MAQVTDKDRHDAEMWMSWLDRRSLTPSGKEFATLAGLLKRLLQSNEDLMTKLEYYQKVAQARPPISSGLKPVDVKVWLKDQKLGDELEWRKDK